MKFVPIPLRKNERAPWHSITHLRLITGRRPDTGAAHERWRRLKELADRDGVIELTVAMAAIEPFRNLAGGPENSIKYDLRYWSNTVDHGDTSRDKGWLELGYLSAVP